MAQLNKLAMSGAPCGPCCEAMDDVLEARLFKALCEPTRLTILATLAQDGAPRTVTDIARDLPVDVSVVSRHLAMLKDAGVLSAERRGKEVRYAVRYAGLADTFRAIARALDACCPPGKDPISGGQHGRSNQSA